MSKRKLSDNDIKHLLFYGGSSDKKWEIDEDKVRLDVAISLMFQLLEKHTFIDSKAAEEQFWKRIRLMWEA